MPKPGSELVGRTFLHKHWLDPVHMPEKVPAEFKITAVRSGQVYIRPIYDKGGSNERLGSGMYRPLKDFMDKDVLRFTNPSRKHLRGNPPRGEVDRPMATELYRFTLNHNLDSWNKNLTVKRAQGRYDREKAIKLFYYAVERWLKEFERDYQLHPNVPTRMEAARMLRDEFESHHESEFYHYVPKKYRKNPSLAEEISEGFHGRQPTETIDVEEEEQYAEELGVLGCLVELHITRDGGETSVKLRFPIPTDPHFKDGDEVYLAAPNKHQMEFVGGDQEIANLGEIAKHTDKQLVKLGCLDKVVYLTYKYHLDDSDGKEAEYVHELGKKKMFGFSKKRTGRPEVIYDTVNAQLKLVGGTYSITDEGIVN